MVDARLWPYSFLLYFALGRGAYCVITRRGEGVRWFLAAEGALTVGFVIAGRYWVYACPFVWASSLHASVPMIKALILGALFGLPGVGIRLVLPWREVGEKSRLILPPSMDKVQKLDRAASLGVIDFSWLLLLSLGISLVWALATTPPLCDPLPPPGFLPDYYREYRAVVSDVFDQSVDTLIGVSAVLGVCMTILMRGEKWRDSETSAGQRDYQADLRSAIKIVSACFLFVLSFLIWVVIPAHERMVGVLARLKG